MKKPCSHAWSETPDRRYSSETGQLIRVECLNCHASQWWERGGLWLIPRARRLLDRHGPNGDCECYPQCQQAAEMAS